MGMAGMGSGKSTWRNTIGGMVAVLAVPAMLFSTGCQNKQHDENVALMEQNKELQARLAEKNAQPPHRDLVAVPDPVKPPEPVTPKPTQPVMPPAPDPVGTLPPVPAPGPVDLGGLDTTVDPIAGTTTVNFLGDALFDSGKATLKDTSKAALNKVVGALKAQYAGKTVKVQGHTDSDPIKVSKWKSNQELSDARAKAVRDYLVSKGIDGKRVTSEGFGDTKPKDPKDKSKNRRVEIVVLTK